MSTEAWTGHDVQVNVPRSQLIAAPLPVQSDALQHDLPWPAALSNVVFDSHVSAAMLPPALQQRWLVAPPQAVGALCPVHVAATHAPAWQKPFAAPNAVTQSPSVVHAPHVFLSVLQIWPLEQSAVVAQSPCSQAPALQKYLGFVPSAVVQSWVDVQAPHWLLVQSCPVEQFGFMFGSFVERHVAGVHEPPRHNVPACILQSESPAHALHVQSALRNPVIAPPSPSGQESP
jgi:hypothetical protein